jgi:hypothetical protein
MSVQAPQSSYESRLGHGWITFAAIVLAIVGTMNVIGGIAAIDDANFYVADAQFVISDLSTWGWALAITGAVQLLAVVGLLSGNQLARWLAVMFAALNALLHLLFLPAFPLWSLALITIDILVVYGLIMYGDREGSNA